MKKIGPVFDSEWPHLSIRVTYRLPGDEESQGQQMKYFLNHKKDLAGKLIPLVEKEMEVFISSIEWQYPTMGSEKNGVRFDIGKEEKYFTLQEDMGHFVSEHNLVGFSQNAIPFNITSSLIEFMNPNLTMPRILYDKYMSIQHILPHGAQLLNAENAEWKLDQEHIDHIAKIGGIDEPPRLEIAQKYQKLIHEQAEIIVQNGVLTARPLSSHGKFSWLAAKLMEKSFRENKYNMTNEKNIPSKGSQMLLPGTRSASLISQAKAYAANHEPKELLKFLKQHGYKIRSSREAKYSEWLGRDLPFIPYRIEFPFDNNFPRALDTNEVQQDMSKLEKMGFTKDEILVAKLLDEKLEDLGALDGEYESEYRWLINDEDREATIAKYLTNPYKHDVGLR